MPFITEKIWLNIPHVGESIMVEHFPELDDKILNKIDSSSETKIKFLFGVIGEIRKLRSELNINPAQKIKVNIKPKNKEFKDLLTSNIDYIYALAKLESLQLEEPSDKKGYIKTIKDDNELYVYLLDVIDLDLEIKRVSGDIAKTKIDIEKSSKKISNPQFIEKAPKEIIEKEAQKLDQANKALQVLNDQLKKINNIKE
jgi:valyl-tRNA synthetase